MKSIKIPKTDKTLIKVNNKHLKLYVKLNFGNLLKIWLSDSFSA